MQNPAPAMGNSSVDPQTKHTSALMGKLKHSFASGSKTNLGSLKNTNVSQTTATSPISNVPQNKHDSSGDLDVLEQVLDEVEQQKQAKEAQDLSAIKQNSAQDDSSLPKVDDQPPPVATLPGNVAQAVPQAVDHMTDNLNPTVPTTSMKESAQPGSLEQGVVDAIPGAQVVEHEVSPEIPVEVESYIERVEETGHMPHQITLAGDQIEVTPVQPTPKQSVVVLPITQEIEKEGAHKSPKLSIRWLVEWSRKLMKMFTGKVIYREN